MINKIKKILKYLLPILIICTLNFCLNMYPTSMGRSIITLPHLSCSSYQHLLTFRSITVIIKYTCSNISFTSLSKFEIQMIKSYIDIIIIFKLYIYGYFGNSMIILIIKSKRLLLCMIYTYFLLIYFSIIYYPLSFSHPF